MGYTLPSPSSPAEQARALITRKDAIEDSLRAQFAVLEANDCTLHTPLVDADGFPRADIDVYQVRGARVRIIELRNDLKTVMDALAKALQGVYDPSLASEAEDPATTHDSPLQPFAKIDGVAPGSPAADAGLQREDLVIKFGQLNSRAFTSTSLQPLADVVAASENRSLPITVLRAGQNVYLTLTPRKGWGGRGMLGCHLVPYSS